MLYSRRPPFALVYRQNDQKVAKRNELEILKESVKTVGKDYCEESSISGLKHLVDSDASYLERYMILSDLRS